MSGRRLMTNAASATIQVVVSALALFATYWLMMQALTIAEIGLWSLVLGTTMVARLSELGLGAGVLRFVAADLAVGDPRRAARTVGMAACAATLLVGMLALALAPALHGYLLAITPRAHHAAVGILLPAALLAVVLGTAGNVMLAALDGCQRMDLRAGLQILGSLIQLGATWFVLPRWGLAGLGLVQVLQAGAILLAGAVTAIMLLRRPPSEYLGFDRSRFGELVRYSGSLQAAAIAQLLFEPLLKVLLATHSGLTLTGYFDMANRIVLQFRSLVVAAYSALVPHVAALTGAGRIEAGRIAAIYRKASAMLLFLVLPYFACLAAMLPLALTLWKGQFEPVFIAVALLQCGAWMINLVALPSYLLNTGTGELRWNVVSHGVTGLVMLLFGSLLGTLWGGTAVLVAGAFALIGGSLLVPLAFHRRYEIAPGVLLGARRLPVLALLLTAFAGSAALAAGFAAGSWAALVGWPVLIGLLALTCAWFDPHRAKLIARLEVSWWSNRQ
jgi:O-antigen/teichoic acid export membrane protein